jgi:hypothetical protein
MAKEKGAKWERIGELRKTKRPDMLVGNVEIKDLGLKLRVVAFIRTNEQKRNLKEPDIVILLPKDESEETEVQDNLFD